MMHTPRESGLDREGLKKASLPKAGGARAVGELGVDSELAARAVTPKAGDTLYLRTNDLTLLRFAVEDVVDGYITIAGHSQVSVDGGKNWYRLGEDCAIPVAGNLFFRDPGDALQTMLHPEIRTRAVKPKVSDVLYLRTDETVVVCFAVADIANNQIIPEVGMRVSVDSGKTWTDLICAWAIPIVGNMFFDSLEDALKAPVKRAEW